MLLSRIDFHILLLIQPKTDFEKKMMEMWSGSKNNMTNDTIYTEAEMEIIRAMDVKEVLLTTVPRTAFSSILKLSQASEFISSECAFRQRRD